MNTAGYNSSESRKANRLKDGKGQKTKVENVLVCLVCNKKFLSPQEC